MIKDKLSPRMEDYLETISLIEEKKEAIVETSKNEFDDGEFFIRMKDEEFFLYGFVKEKENLLEIYIDEIFTQEHVL